MTYALPLNMGETVVAHLPHPPGPIANPLPPAARIRTRSAILSCTACGLRAGCRRPVPWDGPAPNRLLVLGEAPGMDEDASGVPFVGKSGRLLRQALRAVGLAPVDPITPHPVHPVTFANTVSCRPAMHPPTPRLEHMEACAPHLARQLRVVAPDHVLLVGGIALSRFRSDLRISAVHGRPFVVPHPAAPASTGAGLWCFPVIHPASILRDRSQEVAWRADLDSWAAMVTSPHPPTDHLPLTCTVCRAPVDRYDPDGMAWCDNHHSRGTAGWQAATKKRRWLARTEMLTATAMIDVPTPQQAPPANPT